MKRIVIIMTFAVAVSVAAYSQFTIGPKAGGNISKLAYDNKYLNTEAKYGFQLGGFIKYDFTSSWFIQSELMYSRHRSFFELNLSEYGGGITIGGYNITYNYLLVPVVGGYRFGNSGFYIEAGFQPGVYLDSHYSIKNNRLEDVFNDYYPEKWNSMMLSMVGGFGYNFRNGLTLSARYCHGLTNNSLTVQRIESTNHTLQFSAAYNLWSF